MTPIVLSTVCLLLYLSLDVAIPHDNPNNPCYIYTIGRGKWRGHELNHRNTLQYSHNSNNPSNDDPKCALLYRKFLAQSSKGSPNNPNNLRENLYLVNVIVLNDPTVTLGFSQEWDNGYLNDLTLYGPAAIVGWYTILVSLINP